MALLAASDKLVANVTSGGALVDSTIFSSFCYQGATPDNRHTRSGKGAAMVAPY